MMIFQYAYGCLNPLQLNFFSVSPEFPQENPKNRQNECKQVN